jgi:hypothetical protein
VRAVTVTPLHALTLGCVQAPLWSPPDVSEYYRDLHDLAGACACVRQCVRVRVRVGRPHNTMRCVRAHVSAFRSHRGCVDALRRVVCLPPTAGACSCVHICVCWCARVVACACACVHTTLIVTLTTSRVQMFAARFQLHLMLNQVRCACA